MRIRSVVLLVVALLATSVTSLPAFEPDVVKAVRRTAAAVPPGAFREGEVIVSFRAAAEPRDVERDLRSGGAREVHRSRAGSRYLVLLDPGTTVAAAVGRFAAMPEVEYAEPNGLVRQHRRAPPSPRTTATTSSSGT